MTRKGHPLLHLTTVFVTGTTTALLQGSPQHLLKPDHKRWERSTTAFVKGITTVCLKGRPQHYLRFPFILPMQREKSLHPFLVFINIVFSLKLASPSPLARFILSKRNAPIN